MRSDNNHIENLHSYAFLLFFKLGPLIKKGINILRDDEMGYNDELDAFIEHCEQNGWQNIYDFFDNPKLLIDFAYFYLQFISKLQLISEEEVELLLVGYYKIDPTIKNLSNVVTKISATINVNYRQRMAFDSIHDGYLDFIGNLEDHNMNYSQLIKRFRKITTSDYKADSLLEFSKQSNLKEEPINQYIIDNLPMEILKKFPNLTDTRINGYFRRKLASDLQKALIPLEVTVFVKLSFTGFIFSTFSMCETFEEFSARYSKKHTILIADEKVMHGYFQEYLYNQADNSLK